jgi:hypothetical protein
MHQCYLQAGFQSRLLSIDILSVKDGNASAVLMTTEDEISGKPPIELVSNRMPRHKSCMKPGRVAVLPGPQFAHHYLLLRNTKVVLIMYSVTSESKVECTAGIPP